MKMDKHICCLKKKMRLLHRLNDIGSMPLLAFENQNLKYLLLHNNQIKTLHSNTGNLTNLEILLLERNRLTLLPPEISILHKLMVLYVSHNQFSIIPETLELAGNKIKTLLDTIVDMKNLKVLNIHSTQISVFSRVLCYLPHLVKLKHMLEFDSDFLVDKILVSEPCKNLFKSMTDNLCNCTMLKHLIIYNNQLIQLPANIHRLNYIPAELQNLCSQFPNALCALFDLKPLNLSGNSISEIIPGISDIKDLGHLELNKNKLSSSSACLCGPTKSVYLDVSENEITSMPAVVCQVKALQVLLLHHNKFDSFPEEFCSLKCLKTLDISNNQIKSIPFQIRNLEAIKYLNVPNTQFGSFPFEICHLSSLETSTVIKGQKLLFGIKLWNLILPAGKELHVCQNALKEIPNSIGELEYLVHLIANNNDIGQLPKSITSLRNLQQLDLSGEYQAFNPLVKSPVTTARAGQRPVVYKTDLFLLQRTCVCALSCLSNIAGVMQPVTACNLVWITTGGLSCVDSLVWVIQNGIAHMGYHGWVIPCGFSGMGYPGWVILAWVLPGGLSWCGLSGVSQLPGMGYPG
uniref:Leucine-rich repeat and death domain-containing protein 1 n=1 Tax=Strix occidentalis caurina TaxID=311401 RepID=A0A8D0FNK8_STROC